MTAPITILQVRSTTKTNNRNQIVDSTRAHTKPLCTASFTSYLSLDKNTLTHPYSFTTIQPVSPSQHPQPTAHHTQSNLRSPSQSPTTKPTHSQSQWSPNPTPAQAPPPFPSPDPSTTPPTSTSISPSHQRLRLLPPHPPLQPHQPPLQVG